MAAGDWHFEVQVYFGDLNPDQVKVELFANSTGEEAPVRLNMISKGPIPGSINGFLYAGDAPKTHPAEYYTPRVVPSHPDARIPLEENHILWAE